MYIFIDWYILFVHTYRLLDEVVTSDLVYYYCSDDEIALNVSVHQLGYIEVLLGCS